MQNRVITLNNKTMKTVEEMTKQELQNEIVCNNDGLYEMFDENKLLNDLYSHEELITITQNWIMQAPDFTYIEE